MGRGDATLAVTAYGLLAAVEIAVFNPLPAAPGVGLDQIRADMAAGGETLGAWWLLCLGGYRWRPRVRPPPLVMSGTQRLWLASHSKMVTPSSSSTRLL